MPRIAIRTPVVIMLLAATAIPVELRPHVGAGLGLAIVWSDVLANVAGYVPLGMVLQVEGIRRVAGLAFLLATAAETGQLFMMHRDPSIVDIVSNLVGAILGAIVATRWRLVAPEYRVPKTAALAAAGTVAALMCGVWMTSGTPLSARGLTVPGRLEGRWGFDNDSGLSVDSSGSGLHGRFSSRPVFAPGVFDRALRLDGGSQAISLNRASAPRLTGSMTVSAWISSTRYPDDDAVIVSTLSHIADGASSGFQLDTTVDRGPRTIGFKLTDTCGNLVAQYGATSLGLQTWYHVAGVYNAEARTMDVYLNGQRDNGPLKGVVSGSQRSSRNPFTIGKRPDFDGFEFAGAIDDVQVYSMALTHDDIERVMRGGAISTSPASDMAAGDRRGVSRVRDASGCDWSSERQDARIPVIVCAVGMLIAVAGVGLWGPERHIIIVGSSVLAGLILNTLASPTLPSLNVILFPATSLAGGVSILASVHRDRPIE